MYSYQRTVRYYETDKMGITHHSNYVRWMEEARIAYLESIGLPFEDIEAAGIVSPVVSVSLNYKKTTTFPDVISIEISISRYTGIRFEVCYTMKNAKTGEVVTTAASSHCFLKDGQICSLKRLEPSMHEKLQAAYLADQK